MTATQLDAAARALLDAADALMSAVAADLRNEHGPAVFEGLAGDFDDGLAAPRLVVDFGTGGARLRVLLIGAQAERPHAVELLDIAAAQQSRAGGIQ